MLLFLWGCRNATISLGGDQPPPGDAGFFCTYDVDCAPWHGVCFDGGCQALSPDGGWDCNPASGPQPCALFSLGPSGSYCTDTAGGNLCYCHPNFYFDQGGVCYRAIPECGTCTDSIDCGGTQTDLNKSAGSSCLHVGDAGTFCLFTYFGECDLGYLPTPRDGGLYVCYPHCNTCPCSPCLSNSDCPDIAIGVCGKTGACVAPCFSKADCSPAEVCHILGKYLNPELDTYYGVGQCGPSCGSNADCAQYQEGVNNPLLACVVDRQYPDGGPLLDDAGVPLTAARCRVDGCMSTDECILTNMDAGGVTWCDIWNANLCIDNYCQIGTDLGGQPYYRTQCQKGDWCVNDAGTAPQDDAGPEHGFCSIAPCDVGDGGSADCGVQTCPCP